MARIRQFDKNHPHYLTPRNFLHDDDRDTEQELHQRTLEKHDSRYDIDVDFDKHRTGYEVDVKRHDKNYDVDLDLEKNRNGYEIDLDIKKQKAFDIDLKLDVDLRHGLNIDLDLDIDIAKGNKGSKGLPFEPDHNPLTTIIGGEGNAVGQDTLVDSDFFCRTLDLGAVTLAIGDATFKATAVSAEGELGFAAADTFADISGADFAFIFTEKSSTSFSKDGITYATEISHTSYLAIDFDDFDLAGGPVVVSTFDAIQYLGNGHAFDFYRAMIPNIDGNVATLDVDALAAAQNTLVDVFSSVLTVEDQISSISAVVVTSAA
jgi:hypothetical protein